MHRLRPAALCVFALLTPAVAYAVLLALDVASMLSNRLSSERAQTRDPCGAKCRLALSPPAKQRTGREPAAPEAPTFDAVQVSPDGPSVFAGRAPPGAHVAVLVDQRPFATATADEHGDWVAVTEKKIGGGDHKFSLTARLGRDGAPIYGQIIGRTVAPAIPNNKVMPAKVNEAVSPSQLPRPITFLYDQTTFTAEGRRAAQLLAEYLRTRRHQAVTLTGHADERGSDSYNMELSRQRLEAVARYLRENGAINKLELVPKGRSEPFAGAHRSTLAHEEALQLDRRVELRPPP